MDSDSGEESPQSGAPERDPFAGPDWQGDPSRTGPSRRRKRRRRTTRQRWSRRIRRTVVLGGGSALVLGAAWIAVTAFLAHSDLADAKSQLAQLRADITAGHLDEASQTADQLQKKMHRAHQLTSGPAWFVAAAVPYVGDPLDTARGLSASADFLGETTLPRLLHIRDDINPSELWPTTDQVDVDRVAQAAPSVRLAAADLRRGTADVGKLPVHTWLPAVDRVRSTMLTDLGQLTGTMDTAARATQLVPSMLGSTGPKRYFVALLNESESRGIGGLPGGFAIVLVDHGKVRVTHLGSDSELVGVHVNVNMGHDYDLLYGSANPTGYIANTTISPNFPDAARIWAAMWEKKSRQRVDGAVSLDPTALSYLLGVTGPATMPNGSKITAQNVVALTQKDAYQTYAVSQQRKKYLVEVTQAAATHVLTAKGSPTAFLRAAARAVGERRLLVWSADPADQKILSRSSISGIIPRTTLPYAGLVVVNAAGGKLDYYLARSLTWKSSGCGDTRRVTATITLTNNAPAHGLPSYVTGRLDTPPYPVKPGDNRLEVLYYATEGANMTSISIDGKPSQATSLTAHGHPVFDFDLELPRGASRQITLQLQEPATARTPTVLRQPLVQPMRVDIQPDRCAA